MAKTQRFLFASAPVSWGIQDDPGPEWKALPYDRILDEIVAAGYTGTELGPYGYFHTDPKVLGPALKRRKLTLLSSFVPVPLTDPAESKKVVAHVRKVGKLLSALGARLLVLADCQTPERNSLAGRVPADGSKSLGAEAWKHVGEIVAQVERAAAEYNLRLVFHPHVATHVETPYEVGCFFDAVSATKTGLCLDTGHCVYGGGDPVDEARKYSSLLRYVHIKDIDAAALGEARKKKMNFGEGIGAGVFSQIGKGCINFRAFFDLVRDLGYSGWFVVEQDVIFGQTKVPPVESMRASLQYLKQVVSAAGVAA